MVCGQIASPGPEGVWGQGVGRETPADLLLQLLLLLVSSEPGGQSSRSGASETKPLSLENTRMDCCVGTRLISATNVAEGSETVLSGLGKTETRLLLRARCRLGRAGRPFSCEAGLQTFGVVITLYSCYPQHFYLKSVVGTFRRLIKNLNI